MTSAELVFKQGFAPIMSTKALTALLAACETDDIRLTQGGTTTPPPMMGVRGWACEGSCGIGYAGWQGEELDTVGEVEEYFAMKCFQSDELLGEPAACRWFLNFFDDTPRGEMLTTLAGWIRSALADRDQLAAVPEFFAPEFTLPECGFN